MNLTRPLRFEIGSYGEWPLDLEPILDRLGIIYRHVAAGERRGVAYLQLGKPPIITLIRTSTDMPGETRRACGTQLSRRDRFSVAHELAHYLLWQRGKIPPAITQSQYWQHEALCNEFANRLLVARLSLRAFLNTVDASIPAADYPRLVARKANVTWPVAARAISAETGSRFCYLRVAPRQDNIDLLQVDCSSLGSGFQNFPGQAAFLYDKEVNDSLLLIKQITESGHGFLYKLPVTLSFGSLHLNNVPCNVIYRASRWVLQFSLNKAEANLGSHVTDARSLDEGEPNKEEGLLCMKRECGLESLALKQMDRLEPLKDPLVTPVQRMAIKRLMGMHNMSCFDEAKVLANRFLKIKIDHLTLHEGTVLLKDRTYAVDLGVCERSYCA